MNHVIRDHRRQEIDTVVPQALVYGLLSYLCGAACATHYVDRTELLSSSRRLQTDGQGRKNAPFNSPNPSRRLLCRQIPLSDDAGPIIRSSWSGAARRRKCKFERWLLAPFGAMITVTANDDEPFTAQRVVVNGRKGEPGCDSTVAREGYPALVPAKLKRGDAANFQAQCGDSILSADIYTDRGTQSVTFNSESK